MAKDHARERKKPFFAKTKVYTFANFVVGRLIKKKKRRRWRNRRFSNFLYVIVAVYFTYFESFNTRRPYYVSEKAYNCLVQEI